MIIMTYGIRDHGACLRIESDAAGTLLVLKHSVKEIIIVRETKVTLVRENPLRNITLDYRNVVNPVVESAWELAYNISAWIEECVCCGEDLPV